MSYPSTAYLLVFVDVAVTPAAIVSAGIYSDSERGITLPRNIRALRLFDVRRPTFAEAVNELRIHIEADHFAWVRPMIARPLDAPSDARLKAIEAEEHW